MKLKPDFLFLVFLLTAVSSYGQMGRYHYQRELKGISGQWHKVVLPDAFFGAVSDDLQDVRIYGITEKKDTIEAPYLFKQNEEKTQVNQLDFKILNVSYNEKGSYFTMEIAGKEPINQIIPVFQQTNFDWKVTLQGSQDQKEWFTILENYRILSIKNNWSDYQFTRIDFPDASYRYFRLHLPGKDKAELLSARCSKIDTIKGQWKRYPVKVQTTEHKAQQQTWVDIQLKGRVPVSSLKVHVKDSFDYYRPVTIEYLSDSVHSEKGWIYNYRLLGSGTLNSMENNEFKFHPTLLQKVRVIIGNQDNQSLAIDMVEARGPVNELVVRFSKKARYFLVYGNPGADAPQYDLAQFADKIPSSLTSVEVGNEQVLDNKSLKKASPLFRNKAWLWVVMGVIIALLGWFTLGMMKKQQQE